MNKKLRQIYNFILFKCGLLKFLNLLFGNYIFYFLSFLITNRPNFFLKKNQNCILIGVYNPDFVKSYSDYVFLNGDGNVFVFEISNENILNLKRKNFENVVYFNYGLADEEKSVTFQQANNFDGQGYNKLINSEIKSRSMENSNSQYTIENVKVLDIFKMIDLTKKKIDFISLTCNGAELYVFRKIKELKIQYPKIKIYCNVEYPYPFSEIINNLKKNNIRYISSSFIRTTDKKTKLRRILVF